MQHKWMRLYQNAVWTGASRTIRVNGTEHNLDEYAAQLGITLPDADIQVNTNEDMEQAQHTGDNPESGDRDSQSAE